MILVTTALTPETKGHPGGYKLGSGLLPASRLNYQHFLWRELLGFNIEPRIANQLPPRPVIADVATGTGIWAVDVARNLPDASIHGFDINLSQVPPRALRPANVDFQQWSLFEDPPTDLCGKFDLIHMRLVVAVIFGEQQARLLIQRLTKMLKPGGCIQWDEMSMASNRVSKVDPTIPSPASDVMVELFSMGGRNDWSSYIGDYMTEEGLRDVQADYHENTRDLMQQMSENQLWATAEMLGMFEPTKATEEVEHYQRLVDESYEEGRQGVSVNFPKVVAVGRKAIEAQL